MRAVGVARRCGAPLTPRRNTHTWCLVARYGAGGLGRLRPTFAIREPRASHIWFIVRDDNSRADLVFQTADPTYVG